jgi:cysteine desulfurase/selenocysteine lyase
MKDSLDVRNDFPIFTRVIGGHPLVYLDNAATSQKPKQVIDAVASFSKISNANVHRGIYTLSEEATAMYEGVREKVAAFIHAKSPKEIIFTRNATESLNLVALSWGRQNLKKGDEIITTVMEHHSNIVPWQMLAKERGIILRFVPMIMDAGILDIDAFKQLINPRTKLVCVGHISNLLGTVNPIKVFAAKAHEVGAKIVVDGCQAVPHMPIDVQDLHVDFYAFSSHKMLGPTGVGVLWAREEILEATEPALGGGDMIKTVTQTEATWNEIPWKFEAGTPDVSGVIGLGAAIDYLSHIGMKKIWDHEQQISQYVLPKLLDIDGVHIFGVQEANPGRGAIFSFWINGMHPHDIASILDEAGIAIRAGHMCAQPLLNEFKKPAAARASFYAYNTIADADAFLGAIEKAKSMFE